jgi:hypothetical protein
MVGKMKYLIRKKKAKVAHYLDQGLNGDIDTYCTLYSTGGLNKRKYIVFDDNAGLDICVMCEHNYKKQIGKI